MLKTQKTGSFYKILYIFIKKLMREFFLKFSLWVYAHEKIGGFAKNRFVFIICPNIRMMAV